MAAKWMSFFGFFLGWVIAVAAQPSDVRCEKDLSYLERHFRATEEPIVFEYSVAYRFLNVEFSRLGGLVLQTTVGQWYANGSSNAVPAVFLDMRFDSKDRRGATPRARISIHDRIVAVVTVPAMDALLFAKDTDEYLNPIIGRSRTLRSLSCYDVQSGALDYWHYDIPSDSVVTNLSDPEAIVELSRQLRPILDFLMQQQEGSDKETLSPESIKISVNTAGHVVPLRLRTLKEQSPPCLGRARLNALRVDTVSLKKTDERVYRFRGWALPFGSLADHIGDPSLQQAAREAFVKVVVPVAAEYELALGAIRMTLLSAHVDGHWRQQGAMP